MQTNEPLKLIDAERAVIAVLGDCAEIYEMGTGEEWVSLQDFGAAIGVQRWQGGWLAYGVQGSKLAEAQALPEVGRWFANGLPISPTHSQKARIGRLFERRPICPCQRPGSIGDNAEGRRRAASRLANYSHLQTEADPNTAPLPAA